MRLLCLCLSLAALQTSEAQFRGFSNPRSNANHDLLKQIVDHTPEEETEHRLTRFGGGQRSSILDRARSRPNTFTPLAQRSRSRPRFTPSVPRFGSGANNLNLVTVEEEEAAGNTCEDLRGENELLKQLVESLQKQQQASEAREKLLQSQLVSNVGSSVGGGAPSSPLSLISEALRSRLGLGGAASAPLIPGLNGRGVRRVLTAAEPRVTTSTIVVTTSYESLLTTSVTRDLSISFQGKVSTTFVWDTVIETSTITDTVSSVVTITPSQSLGLPQQLNTINFNPEKLGLGPKPEENRSFGNFNNGNALNRQQESLDSFEALQAYLSKFQQSTVSQNTPPPTEATTTSTTTTTQKSLISRLKARKNAYRARFFKPKTNLIKAAISSSLYSASILSSSSSSVTLESSFVTVSSLSPASLATSPIPSPVFSTNVIINVASNVRVAGAGDTVVTVTPALVTSIQTQTEVHTSVSSSVVSDSDDSEDNISLDYDDIIAIDNAKIAEVEEAQSATVQTILPLLSRPDLVTRSSVVTVYLSGSVPGVFSTSLSTVLYPGIRDPEDTEDKEVIDRRKRHVEVIIQPSRTVILDTTEMREDAVNIIESGLNDILHDDSCRDKRITVTVTSTVSYCPVF